METNTMYAEKVNAAVNRDFPLKGNCAAKFAFASIDAAFLESLLPPALTLADQDYTPKGLHPLLFMFQRTHLESDFTNYPTLLSIQQVFSKNKPLLNLDYYEFVLMLPFVKFKDATKYTNKVYCYLPVLYLNSILAVLGGRLFWNFNKRMARFKVSPHRYTIKSFPFNNRLIEGNFRRTGDPIPATSLPNFNNLVPILELPVIEERNNVYASCIYKIDYENVDITPLNCTINNYKSKYLPANLNIRVPSILDSTLGAFTINYNWALSRLELIK